MGAAVSCGIGVCVKPFVARRAGQFGPKEESIMFLPGFFKLIEDKAEGLKPALDDE